MNLSAIPWDFALILFVLAVLIPWRSAVRIRRLLDRPHVTSAQRINIYVSTILFQWLLAGIVLQRALAHGLTFQELALTLRHTDLTLAVAIALTLLLSANQFFSLCFMGALRADPDSFLYRFAEKVLPRAPLESVIFIALSCTAGMSEEFLYRGFVFALIRRLVVFSLVASFAVALILSSAFFAIGHAYQGRRGIITTFVVGTLFAAVRAWTGSLLPPAVAHVAIDLIAGLYARRLLKMPAGSTAPPSAAS